MLFALIGAIIPHLPGLFSLFGKRTDDTATIEKAELRTVRVALRYASIRITLTCIIASVFRYVGTCQVQGAGYRLER